MREIKFRGKREDDNKWVHGVPYFSEGLWWLLVDDNSCTGEIGTGSFCIIPATVGQYTGFKDRNGTEIYEGDIIKTTGVWEDDGERWVELGVVIYNASSCSFMFKSFDEYELLFLNDLFNPEVIGNIHENHELRYGEKVGSA